MNAPAIRFAALLLFAASTPAFAVCLPVPHYRYVGVGAQCDYATIDAAINTNTASLCPGTTIVVSRANGATYTNQHVVIADKQLKIAGTTDACGAAPPVCDPSIGCASVPPKVDIGGDGANPVFTVSGNSNVTFANLAISGGRGADNSLAGGGGIAFNGNGALTLRNVSLLANSGGNGGGVAFYGNGTLRLTSVLAQSNSATSGGGAVSAINAANVPTALEDNLATGAGGALYVGPAYGELHSTACVFDAGFINNQDSASASAVEVLQGGRLFFNPEGNAECDYAALGALGATHCNAGNGRCNRIGSAGRTLLTRSAHAAIHYRSNAIIGARRLVLGSNFGAHVLHGSSAAAASVEFRDCLVVGNSVSFELVNNAGGNVLFEGCTITDNEIGGLEVFSSNAPLGINRSIVRESKPVWRETSTGISAYYALLNLPAPPGAGATVRYDDPLFVAAPPSYRLAPNSPAIDFAPAGDASALGDLDRQPREVDLTNVPDLYGPRDLGAYEHQVGGVIDRIFLGRFE